MNRITVDDLAHDYYKLLGVDPTAHPSIIKNAYKITMSELHGHPDHGGSPELAIWMNRAREVLLNPVLRSEYDKLRSERSAATPADGVEPMVATVGPVTMSRTNTFLTNSWFRLSFRSSLLIAMLLVLATYAAFSITRSDSNVRESVRESDSSSAPSVSHVPVPTIVQRATELLPQLHQITAPSDYATLGGLPWESLGDSWFKARFDAAVSSLPAGADGANLWALRLEGVGTKNEIVSTPTGPIVLISLCKAHFCSDYRMHIAYGPSDHVLVGVVKLDDKKWHGFGSGLSTDALDLRAVALLAIVREQTGSSFGFPLSESAQRLFDELVTRAPQWSDIATAVSSIQTVNPATVVDDRALPRLFIGDDGEFHVDSKTGPIYHPEAQ